MTVGDDGRRDTTEQLELPLEARAPAPVVGKVLRVATPSPTPPRVPVEEQRLIRGLTLFSGIAAIATIVGIVSIDPEREPTRALGVAATLALALGSGTTALLLLRSYRRHPGVWRVRRRRSVRRGLFAGALVGGYLALRVIGLGGPTGLIISALLVVLAEAAISRNEIDTV